MKMGIGWVQIESFPSNRGSFSAQVERFPSSTRSEIYAILSALTTAPRCCTIMLYLDRSEEHTSELQSRSDLVCRLLLEKKKKRKTKTMIQDKKTYEQQSHDHKMSHRRS